MPDLPPVPLRTVRPLSEEARRLSLQRTLAAAPAIDAIWIFAYGSLMWDPCFTFDAKTTATLIGYRRAFNFWTIQTRGTPESPGLGLGLEPGGQCQGIAYRLSEESRDADLAAIWDREMFTTVYEVRWLPLQTPDGPRPALCFITNPAHEQYAGALAPAQAAEFIARACGTKGRCRDYLELTIETLARHGVNDPALNELLALVDGLPPVPGAPG